MRKTAVEVFSSGAVVGSGLDLAAQVGATAAEAVRSRREPAQVARRRRRAAQRRLRAWSAASVVTVAGGAGVVAIGGLSAAAIVALVFLTVVLTLCVTRGVRAASDLRQRTRVVAALPPPSPRRVAVAAELRGPMARLDGYSDGLRRLVAMIGLVEDDSVRAVRAEVIAAADETERRLRDRAAQASTLIRARRRAAADVGGGLDGTIAEMRREIEDGVAGYGRLVAAANEAATASRRLAQGDPGRLDPNTAPQVGGAAAGALAARGPGAAAPGVGTGPGSAGPSGVGPGPAPLTGAPELADRIDQLNALADGMRELSR
ncbi:phage shock envelope stress response protein PspM [Nakamurella sp.]|uniref:phage shock envelope stress response protein PspM n=1 Tax=Nakamurella sp. TaxID=1869182 RepID=UPI003B3BC682